MRREVVPPTVTASYRGIKCQSTPNSISSHSAWTLLWNHEKNTTEQWQDLLAAHH